VSLHRKGPNAPEAVLKVPGRSPWSGTTWSSGLGSKHRLKYKVDPGDRAAIELLEVSPIPEIPADVLQARIANDGRVHLCRKDSVTIVDVDKGEVEVEFFQVKGHAEAVMDWCDAIFPNAVASEEIGDALELINRWRRDPACEHVKAKIVVKVVSTLVVLALNSIRYVVSSVRGKKVE